MFFLHFLYGNPPRAASYGGESTINRFSVPDLGKGVGHPF